MVKWKYYFKYQINKIVKLNNHTRKEEFSYLAKDSMKRVTSKKQINNICQDP